MNEFSGKRARGLKAATLAAGICFILSGGAVAQPVSNLDSLQRNFSELRFGMFIHFNLNTYFKGWAEPRITEQTNPATGQYYSLTIFNPTKIDCGQWMRAAKSANMKFCLLTCKHHDGFALWPSQQVAPNGKTPYTIAQSAFPNMDVVRMYVDSCRAYGLLPGLYSSMWDVANGVDSLTTVRNWNKVKPFVEGQITELLTNYGDIPFFVIDGWAWEFGHRLVPYQDIRALIKRLQPNCLLIEHNGLTSPFEADIVNYEAPKGGVYPAASNTFSSFTSATITSNPSNLSGGGWFWPDAVIADSTCMPVDSIVMQAKRLESRYSTFILNCPPNRTGLIDSIVLTRLAGVGALWSPNTLRAPLPTQMHNVEYPIRPDTVYVSSAANTYTNSQGFNAIDGMTDVSNGGGPVQTLWKSAIPMPQWVTIDLGSNYQNLNIFGYLPKQDQLGDASGRIKGYTILSSTDNITYLPVTNGVWDTTNSYKTVTFDTPFVARYVRLRADSCYNALGNGDSNAVILSEVDVGGWGMQPTVGVKHGLSLPAPAAGRQQFLTMSNQFSLPATCVKGTYKVSVYTLSGELLYRAITKERNIALTPEYHGATEMKLVRIDPVTK